VGRGGRPHVKVKLSEKTRKHFRQPAVRIRPEEPGFHGWSSNDSAEQHPHPAALTAVLGFSRAMPSRSIPLHPAQLAGIVQLSAGTVIGTFVNRL
jgi:hypothetical protein